MVSGASSPNYNIGYVAGTLRVLPPGGKDQDLVSAYLSTPGRLRVNYHAIIIEKVSAGKGLNTWYFEAGRLAAGIYSVRIISKETFVKTKVIIR